MNYACDMIRGSWTFSLNIFFLLLNVSCSRYPFGLKNLRSNRAKARHIPKTWAEHFVISAFSLSSDFFSLFLFFLFPTKIYLNILYLNGYCNKLYWTNTLSCWHVALLSCVQMHACSLQVNRLLTAISLTSFC